MNRSLRRVLLALGVIVVLIATALVAIPLLVDTPRVQALIASSASHALGRPVHFASVTVAVFPLPAVELHRLEVAEDPRFGATPFLRLDRGQLRLRLRPLLAGRIEFGDLILKEPRIALIQDAEGRWNISTLGASPDARAPARGRSTGTAAGAGAVLASRVKIDRALVTYAALGPRGATSSYRIDDFNLVLTAGGPLLEFQGDGRLNPGRLHFRISDGRIGIAGAQNLSDATLRAHLTLDASDVADLAAAVAGPTPTISGPIKGALAVAGTPGAPKASGDLELPALTVTQTNPHCPEPKRRTLTLQHVKVNAVWEGQRFAGHPVTASLSGGMVTTKLVATMARTLHVELQDLAVKGLPVEKVLVDFLCQGYAVTGPLELTGALALNPVDMWNTLGGTGQLRIGPGKVVGSQALGLIGSIARVGSAASSVLSGDVPSAPPSSPLDFDSITGAYQITNGIVTTRDLLYTSRALKVAVGGEYGLATGRMNLDVTAHQGRSEVKAKVTGPASSPSVRVLPESILRDLDSGKGERGLRDLLKRLR